MTAIKNLSSVDVRPEKVFEPWVKQARVYDLHWIDPTLLDAKETKPLAGFERSRRFKHCGAAIAWARRQIFHGKVYGDHIEMRSIEVLCRVGEIREHEDAAVDITLAGFRRWRTNDSYFSAAGVTTLGAPERKCRGIA